MTKTRYVPFDAIPSLIVMYRFLLAHLILCHGRSLSVHRRPHGSTNQMVDGGMHSLLSGLSVRPVSFSVADALRY